MSVGLILTSLLTAVATVVLFTWQRKRKLRMLLDKIPGPKALPIFGNSLSLEKDSEGDTKIVRRQNIILDALERLRVLVRVRHDEGAAEGNSVETLDGYREPLKQKTGSSSVSCNAAFYMQLEALCFKHADTGLCRLWLGQHLTLFIYRADHLEVFFNGSKNITKSALYRLHHPWLKTGLLTSTGAKWHKRRKMITPTFHFKILEEFLEVMNEQVQILVDLFDRKVGSEPFDVQSYLAHCALDIICETAMGRHVNAQQDTESAYVKALYVLSEYTIKRMKEPWLWPEIIFRMHPAGRAYFKSLKVLHGFTRQVIDERGGEFDRLWEKHRSGKNSTSGEDEETEGGIPIRIGKRMAFLDMLLWTAKKDASLTKEGIQEEVDTFMFEGHDTTAATAAWAFYVIGKHPEIQAKLHNEVDRVFGNDDRPATMEDLTQLKYLECVFKESMRLYPTVPFFGREVCEDSQIGDYFVPKGTTALFMSVPLHRDPKYFPDPDKVDPDRWLTDNPTDKHPFCYIPFSAGLRNCIGQKFAVMEEKVLLSGVLRKFTITCTDPDDIRRSGLVIMRPSKGINITLARRDKYD